MARRNGSGRLVLAAAGLLALGFGLAAVAQVPKDKAAQKLQPKDTTATRPAGNDPDRQIVPITTVDGALNINSLFLIGAQEGASLGLLFTATEWNRTYTTGFKALQNAGTKHVAGEDIAGCVWLGLPQRPNNTNFEFTGWVKNTPLL